MSMSQNTAPRVLYVDDEAINQCIATEILLALGAVADTASDGLQALHLVRTGHYALLISDVEMPVMDGIEALKEIRRHTAELPVIMQTAYAFDTDRRTAEEAGCNGFITKPVMPRELKMYLDKYLIK